MRFRDFLFEVLLGCYLVRHPNGKINSQLGKASKLSCIHFRIGIFICKTKGSMISKDPLP